MVHSEVNARSLVTFFFLYERPGGETQTRFMKYVTDLRRYEDSLTLLDFSRLWQSTFSIGPVVISTFSQLAINHVDQASHPELGTTPTSNQNSSRQYYKLRYESSLN